MLFHSLVVLSYFALSAVRYQALVQASRERYIACEPTLISATDEPMKRELETMRDELPDHNTLYGRGKMLGELRGSKIRTPPFPLICICDRSMLVTTEFAP